MAIEASIRGEEMVLGRSVLVADDRGGRLLPVVSRTSNVRYCLDFQVLYLVTQTARFLRPFGEGGVSPPEQEKLLPPITLGHQVLTGEAHHVLSVALDDRDFRYDN